MMRVTLCLVLFYAIVAYCYPQRVTLFGVPNFGGNFGQDHSNPSGRIDIEDGTADSSDETGIQGPHDFYDPSEVNPYFFSSSFAEMMARMQEMMTRIRQEMNEVLKRIPENSSENSGATDVFSFDSGFDFSDVKNKSTSKTEIIDGQQYIVNETVIRSGNDQNGSIFRVKTIQIKPTEDGATESEVTNHDETTSLPKENSSEEPESVNGSTKNDDNNEIPNEGKVGSEVEDLNKEYKTV